MAFKLTKDEETKFEELRKEVDETFNEISSSVDTYNEEVDKLRDQVGTVLSKYNEKLAEFRSFVDGLAADRREDFDDKTDSWKEGDNGSAADEWISAWENADLEDATIEFPEELKIEFDNHAEVDLPSEP